MFERVMLLQATQCDAFSPLQERLRRAVSVTPELMSRVTAQTGAGAAAPNALGNASRLHRLIEAGAWTDAALALLDLERPQWKLRRLVHEDGEWSCTLCRQWQLPEWIDDTVEARHDVLALAILSAIVEARRANKPADERVPGSVPRCRPRSIDLDALCCDNFA
jgi:hypothetical protein